MCIDCALECAIMRSGCNRFKAFIGAGRTVGKFSAVVVNKPDRGLTDRAGDVKAQAFRGTYGSDSKGAIRAIFPDSPI